VAAAPEYEECTYSRGPDSKPANAERSIELVYATDAHHWYPMKQCFSFPLSVTAQSYDDYVVSQIPELSGLFLGG